MISLGVHLPSNGRVRSTVTECARTISANLNAVCARTSKRIPIAEQPEQVVAIGLWIRRRAFRLGRHVNSFVSLVHTASVSDQPVRARTVSLAADSEFRP